jgi:hypothetical protein
MLGLCVDGREACADCQYGELIDRTAAAAGQCLWSKHHVRRESLTARCYFIAIWRRARLGDCSYM